MNCEQTNIVSYLKIEVITPVHIGAGPDKKWLKGIDYFFDKGKIKIFDFSDFLKDKNKDQNFITNVVNHISKGTLLSSQFVNKGQIKAKLEYPHDREPDEIFTHIRDGLGNIYIPGSSLKGAIRSALLGYLYQNNRNIKQIERNKDIDNKVFGDVHNSVMRFIQITDAEFKKIDALLFNTKIYSMNQEKKGQWKNARIGSEREFKERGFVSTYECLATEAVSAIRIVITKRIIELLENKKPKNTEEVIKINNSRNTNPLVEILRMINDQTKNYLKKEQEFFSHHGGDKTDIILKTINDLASEAEKCSEGECLLHLGSGSGFHGITGDWQFDSHKITGINYKHRGQINGLDAAKTRRFIFIKNGNEYCFYPFGFVKLSIIEENEYTNILNEIKISNENFWKRTRSDENYDQKTTIKNRDVQGKNTTQNLIPYSGTIKQGQGGIPAEVVESGRPNKVRVFIVNYPENDFLPLRNYTSELEVGTKLYVKINQITKSGKIIDVSFEKIIK